MTDETNELMRARNDLYADWLVTFTLTVNGVGASDYLVLSAVPPLIDHRPVRQVATVTWRLTGASNAEEHALRLLVEHTPPSSTSTISPLSGLTTRTGAPSPTRRAPRW